MPSSSLWLLRHPGLLDLNLFCCSRNHSTAPRIPLSLQASEPRKRPLLHSNLQDLLIALCTLFCCASAANSSSSFMQPTNGQPCPALPHVKRCSTCCPLPQRSQLPCLHLIHPSHPHPPLYSRLELFGMEQSTSPAAACKQLLAKLGCINSSIY